MRIGSNARSQRRGTFAVFCAFVAISVPCGFTPEGLPVGLQIVGRHGDDRGVLELAYAFEQATHTGERRPPLSPD